MRDREKLGQRYACYECGTKFYDLNRPEPVCPECFADQRQDDKALPTEERPIELTPEPTEEASAEDDDKTAEADS